MKEIHDMCELENTSIFPIGDENSAFAQHFDGNSYLNMISTQQVMIGNVTFEAGCRNHWHIHHAKKGGGQILLVTAGRGYYQAWGEVPRELRPGEETSTEWRSLVERGTAFRKRSEHGHNSSLVFSRLIPTTEISSGAW